MKPLRKLLPALAVLTGIVLGGCAPADPPVAGSAKVAEARWAAVAHAKIDIEGGLLQLAMPRDGRVAKVLAHEGDRVVEGQIMASLDPAAARLGVAAAQATLERHASRVARALASVINLIDPDVIVLGGGVSRLRTLYQQVPALWGRWVFGGRDEPVRTRLLPALHGDASGVRGAAWIGRAAQ